MRINHYGQQLMRTFEMKCGQGLMEESMRLGTFVLEKYIDNRFDDAAWCLITYDINAIDTVKEWKNTVEEDIIHQDDDDYTLDDLITVLTKCITYPKENVFNTTNNKNTDNNRW